MSGADCRGDAPDVPGKTQGDDPCGHASRGKRYIEEYYGESINERQLVSKKQSNDRRRMQSAKQTTSDDGTEIREGQGTPQGSERRRGAETDKKLRTEKK